MNRQTNQLRSQKTKNVLYAFRLKFKLDLQNQDVAPFMTAIYPTKRPNTYFGAAPYSFHSILMVTSAFSKFYRRHYELISKFNVGLKSLLHQGLSEPEFYGDLAYKFKKIRGMTDFSDQFRKMIMRYKRIGYNLNVMRQSAYLVINPTTVDGYATLFNCTPVDRASASMMAPT